MSLSRLNRNVLRLSGLNSGLDTESIVTAMLTNTQNKVNKQYRTQVKLEWKQEKYQEINNELRKLKDEYNTVLKQEQNMLSEYNYRKYSITMSNDADSAYVSIQAAPYAKESSVTIDYVKQLALAARVESSAPVTGANGSGLKLTDTMREVSNKLILGGGTGLTFEQENGTNYVKMTLDGKDYKFSEYATLDSVLSSINANSENMKISYTQLTDTFTLESRTSGSASTLSFTDNAFLSALGLQRSNVQAGQQAILSINGIEVTRDSNSFEIDGLTYNLKKTFNEDGASDGKNVMFSVARDLDSTVDLIKKYVDSYNELIDKLYETLTEVPKSSYYPLTEDEKSAMTEKQIEQWEEIAKTGLMRNDNQLQTLVSQMRMSFYTTAQGTTQTLASIGIGGASTTTSQYEDAKKGKMFIDEQALRKALTDNPEEVFAMFTAKSDSGNVDEMGLVTRINTLIDNYVKNNEYNTQYYNDQAITRAKERYSDMLNAMYKEEERLYARFTALEKIMSSYNSTSEWIGNQMLS